MFRLFLLVAAIIAVLIVACGRGGVKGKDKTMTPGPSPRATASVVR